MKNKKRWIPLFPYGKERACSFVLNKPRDFLGFDGGWETDSGHFTYGLSFEMVSYICEILNEYGDEEKEKSLKWFSND